MRIRCNSKLSLLWKHWNTTRLGEEIYCYKIMRLSYCENYFHTKFHDELIIHDQVDPNNLFTTWISETKPIVWATWYLPDVMESTVEFTSKGSSSTQSNPLYSLQFGTHCIRWIFWFSLSKYHKYHWSSSASSWFLSRLPLL